LRDDPHVASDASGVVIFRRRAGRSGQSTAVESVVAADEEPVEALVAEVDRLHRDSRDHRDPETLRRLVRLRHQAGARLVASDPPAPGYPSPSTDLPAAQPGQLPDLRPADLTPEIVRGAILRDGCAVVRGLVDPERAVALGQDMKSLFERRDDVETDSADLNLYYEEFVPDPPYRLIERPWVNGAGGLWLADSPRLMSEVFDLYEEIGLRRLITGYLGERPALSVNKSTLRRAQASVSSVDWHQDGAFMGDVRTINVWLSLSKCGDTAPGLAVVPRRVDQIVETGTSGAAFDWSVSPILAEEVAGEGGTLHPTFEPGDVVLFDNFFLHATWVHDQMPDMRYAIESWFFSPSSFPEEYVPLLF
jgi:hypothetical protein